MVVMFRCVVCYAGGSSKGRNGMYCACSTTLPHDSSTPGAAGMWPPSHLSRHTQEGGQVCLLFHYSVLALILPLSWKKTSPLCTHFRKLL